MGTKITAVCKFYKDKTASITKIIITPTIDILSQEKTILKLYRY